MTVSAGAELSVFFGAGQRAHVGSIYDLVSAPVTPPPPPPQGRHFYPTACIWRDGFYSGILVVLEMLGRDFVWVKKKNEQNKTLFHSTLKVYLMKWPDTSRTLPGICTNTSLKH